MALACDVPTTTTSPPSLNVPSTDCLATLFNLARCARLEKIARRTAVQRHIQLPDVLTYSIVVCCVTLTALLLKLLLDSLSAQYDFFFRPFPIPNICHFPYKHTLRRTYVTKNSEKIAQNCRKFKKDNWRGGGVNGCLELFRKFFRFGRATRPLGSS